MAVQTRPHDAQDGGDEQDGAGHVGADEDGGEDRSHDVEGRRGGVGERGDEGVGEGATHDLPPDAPCGPGLGAPRRRHSR